MNEIMRLVKDKSLEVVNQNFQIEYSAIMRLVKMVKEYIQHI